MCPVHEFYMWCGLEWVSCTCSIGDDVMKDCLPIVSLVSHVLVAAATAINVGGIWEKRWRW